MSEAEKIRKNSWKQGSLLYLDKRLNNLKSGLYVVISQDCDIVHYSFDNEPHIELILAKPIDKIEGDFAHGKNPRKIHLPFRGEKKQLYYEFLPVNRYFLDRRKLAEIKPIKDIKIVDKSLRNLIGWIINRYDRAAFPDEFNRRINKNIKKIKKVVKEYESDIHGVYIGLDTNCELDKNKVYKIEFVVIIESEYSKYEMSDEKRLEYQDVLENIVKLLQDNTGIKVVKHFVGSLEDVTVAHLYSLKAWWNFDYLSYENN